MSLIVTVHFSNSFYEIFLSGVNNRTFLTDIPYEISLIEDFKLSIGVLNNIWELKESKQIAIQSLEYSGKAVNLNKGTTLNCYHLLSKTHFTIRVDENDYGYTEFIKYKLSSNTINIGSDDSCEIQFKNNSTVSRNHAQLFCTDDLEYFIKDTSLNGTFVNGKRIVEAHKLNYGDIIYVMGLKLVFLKDIIAINNPITSIFVKQFEKAEIIDCNETDQSNEYKEEYYLRTPRKILHLDTETIEIEAPPSPNKGRRQPLVFTIGPAVTMVIPMSVGVVFTVWSSQNSGSGLASPFLFMGIVTSVTAAFIGVFWSLANYKYALKIEKQDEERRLLSYKKYLEKIKILLTDKHINNKEILEKKYPHNKDCLLFTNKNSRRLWERNINHVDFLMLRLGKGSILSPNIIEVPKERFSLFNDEIAEEPRTIKKNYERLTNVPILISLLEHNLIGVIGKNQTICNNICKILVAQVSAYHSYTDVRMVFIYNEKEKSEFDFAKWLPHTWANNEEIRMIAYDSNSVGEVFYHLSNEFRERLDYQSKVNDKSNPKPHYIFFITDVNLIENEAFSKVILSPEPSMGITTVLLYQQIGKLPNNCTVIIQNDDDYCGYFSLDNSFMGYENVQFDDLLLPEIEKFAIEMSNIRVKEIIANGAVPQIVSFLDMYKTSKIEEVDVFRRWLENRSYESMKAIIGYKAGSVPLFLDINEKYHGPHGLVAGTTGSGKSEMLQTYILSMSLNYHPYEISFILIDYKGGGMAGSFEKLPHVAGIITNLGGNQTNRALSSINSEIKRRQAIFNDYKIKHIDDYIELFRAGKAVTPIAHLIIIADEFAELKKEQPEFVRELISASRVGRSLGVHLILATQKPSGVVDDEIWGNSKFRICLRVQDKQDSMEMIKRPDAAFINNVGRGYFQVGNDEIFETFQSGWSGATYEPNIPFADAKNDNAKMISIIGKPIVIGSKKKVESTKKENKKSQLESVVSFLSQLAKDKEIKKIDDIWLPPLPTKLTLSDLNKGERIKDIKVKDVKAYIGLMDDPMNQRQIPACIDLLEEGHMLVAGSSLSGKTTLLQTLLYSLVTNYTSSVINIYIADYNSRTMSVFSALPHVGDVIFEGQSDKVEKLINLLLKQLADRKMSLSKKGVGTYKEYIKYYSDFPAIIFVIDNFISFLEDNPKQEENLIQLSREAASYGIYLVLTCTSSNDIRNKIRQNINFGIGLQLSDRYEYENVLGIKTNIVAEDKIPGRGVIALEGPLEFQTAICIPGENTITVNAGLREIFEQIAIAWTGNIALKIPQIPENLKLDNLLEKEDFKELSQNKRFMPIGYSEKEAKIYSIDLMNTFCYTISGTERSGKTNLLKAIIKIAQLRNEKIIVFDGPDKELESMHLEQNVDFYLSNSEDLYACIEQKLLPEFIERNKSKARYIESGQKNQEAYFSSKENIIFIIGDIYAFCQAIYSSEKDMKGFMEQMVLKGNQHMISFYASISFSDMKSEYSNKPFFKSYISWREGIHLGGESDSQRIFSFDLPLAERVKKLPTGTGYTIINGETQRIKIIKL